MIEKQGQTITTLDLLILLHGIGSDQLVKFT